MNGTTTRRAALCGIALGLACTATPAQQPLFSAADRARVLADLRVKAAALPFVEPAALSYGRAASGPAPDAALAAHRAALEAAKPAAFDLAGLPTLLDDRTRRSG